MYIGPSDVHSSLRRCETRKKSHLFNGRLSRAYSVPMATPSGLTRSAMNSRVGGDCVRRYNSKWNVRIRAHERQLFPPERVWRRSDLKCVKKHSPWGSRVAYVCHVDLRLCIRVSAFRFVITVRKWRFRRTIVLCDCQWNIDNKALSTARLKFLSR